jgi:hypothetical protein
VESVLFYGAGEVADLAYLYLQLTNLRLAGIIDEEREGRNFFGKPIRGFESMNQMNWDMILLTRLEDAEKAVDKLRESGIAPERIASI